MEDQIKETPPEGEEKQPLKDSAEAEAKKPEEEVEKKVEGEEAAPPAFTKEDVEKIRVDLKADFDIKRKEHDKQYDDSMAQIRKDHEEVLTRERERQNKDFLKSVEDSGGDVDVAKRLVAREEAALRQAGELEGRERTIRARETEQSEASKLLVAHKIATEVGMDVEELLKAKTPEEMQIKKLEFLLDKQKIEQKPKVPTDSGVPSAKGVDFSKMSAEEKVVKGIEGMFT